MNVVTVNLITGLRIVFSLIMLFFPVSSIGFYTCYSIAGITDMIDGTIARRFGAETQFGEKFDMIADLIFVASALYKLIPKIEISIGIWIWIGVIAVIKMTNIIAGLLVQKKFVTVHSWTNRIIGFVLFVYPFSFSIIDVRYSSMAVCLLATFAALQEGRFIRTTVY